jgi:hypothetical protein
MTVVACLASQRFAVLRSQSCFSTPSCGAMNSGGRGRTCLWPGATMLAPRKAWKYSVPPSERRRVEHCSPLILREQKCSVPSSARPSRHWNGVSGLAASIAFMNSRSNTAGVAPSSIRRMSLSEGIADMPNNVSQFDRPWPLHQRSLMPKERWASHEEDRERR